MSSDRIVWALRSLEEAVFDGRAPNVAAAGFLRAFDRTLSPEERAYVAMAFACDRGARDDLTVMLTRNVRANTGAVIAGIRMHLTSQGRATGAVASSPAVASVIERLDSLRTCVLEKSESSAAAL